MNAYELVDALQETEPYYSTDYKLFDNAANMLRQQADRIAELEKQGEPVAWMQMHHKDNVPTKFSPVKVWEDDIPLYTTPQTKPLSDEEIYALWCEADNTELLPEMRLKDGSINYIITTFAKLIEERHGIK